MGVVHQLETIGRISNNTTKSNWVDILQLPFGLSTKAPMNGIQRLYTLMGRIYMSNKFQVLTNISSGSGHLTIFFYLEKEDLLLARFIR